MTTRRLHHEQPESFAFTAENMEWARGQIAKFPEGRQASAVIPLLFRAQEQEGWVSRPAIETVAGMLNMPFIRVLEVATFYFMFKLEPVGSVAHIEVCGTTPCMLCGSEALIEVCKQKISPKQHTLSADGKFSWEEVECLGACSNAPMVQIFKDYYEDLDAESFTALLDEFARGEKPKPGSRKGRFASEPLGGRTSLKEHEVAHEENSSVALATGVMAAPRLISGGAKLEAAKMGALPTLALGDGETPAPQDWRPATVEKPAEGGDDLQEIRGVGDQLEALLHELGYFTFAQIASWTPKNVRWVDQHLAGFRGRIERDEWVKQAKALAEAEKEET